MDARRVPPEEDANEVATEQVRALVRRLVRRDTGGGEAPLFLFDAGYDPVRLQKRLEGCRAQILVSCTPAGLSMPTRRRWNADWLGGLLCMARSSI